MGDWELLQEYARQRSEPAFAELVRRHLNWVYSSALRQVGDRHLAEDVAQAVFILLAGKSGRLRRGTILTGWLFRTTRFVANRAVRSEYRRKRREEAASVMNAITTPSDDIWNQLAPQLDQAVAALSEGDRAAILLRFYEKKSLRELGEQFGISEEAAKKRVSRTVEKLRALLTRRGVVLSSVALAGVLTGQTVQAASAGLGGAVLKASLASASASTALPALARETLGAWRVAKLKLAAGIAAVSVTAAVLVTNMLLNCERDAAPPSSAGNGATAALRAAETGAGPARQSTNKTTVEGEPTSARFIKIHVLDAQTKQPLPGANIDVYGLQRQAITGRTDKEGRYEIELPNQDPVYLEVTAHKKGFVSMVLWWRTRSGTFQLPGEFTFTLEPSTSIGGIVQGEDGQPIAGAAVSVGTPWSNMAGETEAVYTNVDDSVVTDAQGRWRSDQVPADLAKLSIHASHPDYVDYVSSKNITNAPTLSDEKLRDMSAVLVMKKGLVVQGVVLDDSNRPIADANVLRGTVCCGPSTPQSKTDFEGRFRFANVSPGLMVLTFQAEGHAPELTNFDVSSQIAPLEIRLARGNVIRGRVVDPEGNPVAHAWVSTDTWHEHRTLGWWGNTDTEGRFVWSNAPPDEVQFAIGKEGFMAINQPPEMPSLKSSEEERVITLLPVLRVRGVIMDADTGEFLTGVKVTPGSTTMETNSASWNEYGAITSTNGQYQIAFDYKPRGRHVDIDANGLETVYTYRAHVIRVEAEGYEPTNSRPFKSDEGDVVLNFQLKKGSFVSGVVQAPDGVLLENAEVILSTRSANNIFDQERGKTEANGRFSILKSGEDYSLTAKHERGFAYLTREEFQTAAAIVVEPWGRIEGTLRIGNRPGTNETVIAAIARSGYETKAQTDGNGDFGMDKVPPLLLLWLSRQSMGTLGEPGVYRTSLGSVEVHPGETMHLVLGGTGRAVIGRILAPDGYDKPVDWTFSRIDLSAYIATPENFATMTDSEKLAWRQAWFKSEDGKAFIRKHRRYSTMIGDDGSFRIDDVAAGTYQLNVTVNAPPKIRNQISGPPIGKATRVITVAPISDDDPDEPLNIGDIETQK